jgi:hypothetical protein
MIEVFPKKFTRYQNQNFPRVISENGFPTHNGAVMSSIYTNKRKLRKQKIGKGFAPLPLNSTIFRTTSEAIKAAKARGVCIPDCDVSEVSGLLLDGVLCQFLGGMIAPIKMPEGDRVYAVYAHKNGGSL